MFCPSTLIRRTIIGAAGSRWRSADTDEADWSLDTSVATLPGAPVLTAQGQVAGLLGVNNHLWPVSAIASEVGPVVQRGELSRPSFGFRFVMLEQTISTANSSTGALVGGETDDQAVVPKGPADKAGLKPGDVVSAVDHEPLRADLRNVLATYSPGQKVLLTVIRKNRSLDVSVTAGRLAS